MNLTAPSCLSSNPPVSATSSLISLDGNRDRLNLYEYPPGFGVPIISMPSSSNFSAVDGTSDCDRGIPAIDPTVVVVVVVVAVAFPNKLLINPVRYAK